MGVGAAWGLKGAAQRLEEKPFVAGWFPSTKRSLLPHSCRAAAPYGKTAVGSLSQPVIKCLQ